MPDLKISQLPAASALAGTEAMPVVQGGDNVKTTPAAIKTFIGDAAPTGANQNDGLMSHEDKAKLDGIEPSADVNQLVFHGFAGRTGSSLSMTDTVLTLAVPSAQTVWLGGVDYALTGNLTLDLGETPAVGLHFIVAQDDGSGSLELAELPSAWSITETSYTPVASVYWQGTAGAVLDERHGHDRNLGLHSYLHHTVGARIENDGSFAQTRPTTANDGQIELVAGSLWDEDIENAISTAQGKLVRNWYETASGVWTWANGTDNSGYDRPYLWNSGTSLLRYPNTGSAYALTDVASNRFIAVWVYASNDVDRPIYIVTPALATTYTTVANARAATAPVLPFAPELKLLYRFIYRGDGEYQEAADYRTASSLPSGGVSAPVAASVTFSPSGNIAATNVQAALEELDAEKLAIAAIDDTPVDGATTAPISSNWAYDHLTLWHQTSAGIGIAGQQGFGVGLYPTTLPTGFSVMAGTADPASDNYGNYQYSDGSVMCWIPKFYYRIGSASSPLYARFAANAIDIAAASAFADTAAANAAGYALHRAFIDGGVEQPGFFVDKYECSNNSGVASSTKNGAPLSTAAAHNPIASLTGNGQTVANNYAGCINAAKTRGNDFHCISRFQWAALALLATAHGQAATSATYCAWFDAAGTTNFPKGNNNNAFKDTNDTTVVWESDGYASGNSGKTGSAGYGGGSGNLFAKSCHNGQNCGVADLNGNMYEVSLGMTCVAADKTITGASKTNPCQITIVGHGYSNGDVVLITSVGGMTQLNDKLYAITVTGDDTFTLDGIDSSGYTDWTTGGSVTKGAFYVAKEATAMKSFTGGNSLATDHWGATGVAAMMDAITPAFATGSGFAQRYGSTTNQVLEEEASGNAWLLTGLGLPKAGGMSAGGSNLFGADYYYQYIRNELCLISGGYWNSTSTAGVWSLYLNVYRSNSTDYVGLRCGAYV